MRISDSDFKNMLSGLDYLFKDISKLDNDGLVSEMMMEAAGLILEASKELLLNLSKYPTRDIPNTR